MATRANLPPITSLHKITHISRPAPRPAVTRAPACRRGRGGSLGVLPLNKAAGVRRLGRGKIGSGSCNHTTQQTEQTGWCWLRGVLEWAGWDGMALTRWWLQCGAGRDQSIQTPLNSSSVHTPPPDTRHWCTAARRRQISRYLHSFSSLIATLLHSCMLSCLLMVHSSQH